LEGCDSTTELLPPSRFRALGTRHGGLARLSAITYTLDGGTTPRRNMRSPDSFIECFLRPLSSISCVPIRTSPGGSGPANQSAPDAASEGWWRGKDSNLRSH
jgi:hypothetical protein